MSTKHLCLESFSLLSTIRLQLGFSLYNPQKISHPRFPCIFAVKCELSIRCSNLQYVFLLKNFRIKNKTTFENKVQGLSSNKYSKLHNVNKYPKTKKAVSPTYKLFSIHSQFAVWVLTHGEML